MRSRRRSSRPWSPVELRFVDLFLTMIAAMVLVVVVALIVLPAPEGRSELRIRTRALPPASERQPYALYFAGAGGRLPYRWTVTSGVVMPGLRFDGSSGVLTGAPSESGTMPFELLLRDGAGDAARRRFTLRVRPAARPAALRLHRPVALLREVRSTKDYRNRLAASGGVFPYKFAVSSRSLPPGLELAASGEIHGHLKLPGFDKRFDAPWRFAVTVTDARGRRTRQELALPLRNTERLPGILRTPLAVIAFVTKNVVAPVLLLSLTLVVGFALIGFRDGFIPPSGGVFRHFRRKP